MPSPAAALSRGPVSGPYLVIRSTLPPTFWGVARCIGSCTPLHRSPWAGIQTPLGGVLYTPPKTCTSVTCHIRASTHKTGVCCTRADISRDHAVAGPAPTKKVVTCMSVVRLPTGLTSLDLRPLVKCSLTELNEVNGGSGAARIRATCTCTACMHEHVLMYIYAYTYIYIRAAQGLGTRYARAHAH